MATIHVEVTQEDIDRGERESCKNCPVARALWHALEPMGRFDLVHAVGENFTLFPIGKPMWIDVPSPNSVKDFILAFDAEAEVEPFSFDLQIPDEVV